MRWLSNRDRCGCVDSGSCRIVWSENRAVFDGLVDKTAYQEETIQEEALHMRYFRKLLQILHPHNLSEDDIDSGEVALHSAQGTITWSLFEKWHKPYFEVSLAMYIGNLYSQRISIRRNKEKSRLRPRLKHSTTKKHPIEKFSGT